VTRYEELSFWWWGEDEAPGIGAWLDAAGEAFEAESGTRVGLRLLRHDEVLPGFPAAARAGRAPDLHFLWNGLYHIEFAWNRLLLPLNDLFEQGELDAFGGGPQSSSGARIYRVGWYVIPVMWVANLDVLALAGIERPPETWDELLYDCERVRSAGLRPLTAGDGEGDFSVWWLTHFLTQELDHVVDVARLVLGELDWREEQFSGHWRRLAELRSRALLDEDALPLTLWSGLERFNEGLSAFTLASGPMFAACRRALGEAAIPFVAPVAGDGSLAGLPIVDTQGIGISASCNNPALAAAYLRFLHDEERRASLWRDVELLPADHRWEGPEATAASGYRTMWEWYAKGPSAGYVPNLLPLELHYRIAAEIGRDVLADRLVFGSAGAEADRQSRAWRADKRRVDRYRAWTLEVAASSP
jgi:raffinose/stachyose/melibiose transport system substrate-binding protein